MREKNLRPIVSVGMFDMIKGISILGVVIAHSWFQFVTDITGYQSLFVLVIGILLYSFAIAAGFGLRKRSIQKCFVQQCKTYIFPYVYTAIGATVMLFIVHFVLYRSVKGAASESFKVLSGFILGQYPTTTYFGFKVYACGPMWFVVALFFAVQLYNLFLNLSNGNKSIVFFLVFVSGIIATLVGSRTVTPFCVFQALSLVPGLYVGSLAKEKKLYEKKISFWMIVICLVCYLVLLYKCDKKNIGIAQLEYPFGIISLSALCVASFSLVLLFTRINRRKNIIISILEWLGHNSIYILCLHGVEFDGGCWYRLTEKYAGNHIVGFIVLLFERCLFIVLGMIIVKTIQRRNFIHRD